MKMKLTVCTAIAVAAIRSLVVSPAGADCSDLERVVALAPGNFDEIKGELDRQTRKYPVKEYLPDARYCYVQVSPLSETYSCDWDFGDQQAPAVETYNRFLADVRSCLQPNEEKPRSDDNQGTTSESISFYLDDGIIVNVRRMFHLRVHRNVVYLTVRQSGD